MEFRQKTRFGGYFILPLKQGNVLSAVLFSFTEECKQISDVTNLKN